MYRIIYATKRVFQKQPFLTNCAVYGGLFMSAEFIQQKITKRLTFGRPATCSKHHEIDYESVGRYAVMGTGVFAPTLYIWYKWLDRRFPGTTLSIVLKKLALEQLFMNPFLCTLFFTGMALMEGAENPLRELQEQLIPELQRSVLFWVPVNLFNFLLVTPRFRVIVMGACDFIYTIMFCWFKQRRSLNSVTEI